MVLSALCCNGLTLCCGGRLSSQAARVTSPPAPRLSSAAGVVGGALGGFGAWLLAPGAFQPAPGARHKPTTALASMTPVAPIAAGNPQRSAARAAPGSLGFLERAPSVSGVDWVTQDCGDQGGWAAWRVAGGLGGGGCLEDGGTPDWDGVGW